MDSKRIFSEVMSVPHQSRRFERINNMHEPKAAPAAKGLTCAGWIDDLLPAGGQSGQASTTALLVCMIRVYCNVEASPPDTIDPRVFDATDDLWARYHADLTLGGTVMTVDVFGMAGIKMRARAGYIEQDKKMFRCQTTTLPLLVANAWPQIN
jgi:hypothetical protein